MDLALTLQKPRNMRFVQKAKESNEWTELHLPGILDYWEEEMAFEGSPRENVVCILMEYIQGPTIESIWSQLGGEEQRQIYQQVSIKSYGSALVMPLIGIVNFR
jgi:hypothetical protein